jgi:hypothetical protein
MAGFQHDAPGPGQLRLYAPGSPLEDLQGDRMAGYRCYSLGEDGKIRSAVNIQCPSDAAAIKEAERRLATCGYPAIEVWQGARRVGIVGPSRIAGIAAAIAAGSQEIAQPPRPAAEDIPFTMITNDLAAQ